MGNFLPNILAEQGVEVLPGEREPFGTAVHQREILHADDALQVRHTVFVQVFPYLVAHEEQLGLAVVDDVVHIVRFEFVQDGDDDGPVGQGGQESHAPVPAVAPAERDLVSRTDAGRLEQQVHLGDFPGHVLVLQAFPVEVRERFPVPVLFYAVFNEFDELVFHVVRQCQCNI